MALFDFLKGKEQQIAVAYPVVLEAVARGECVPMEQIPDPVFSTGVLGVCCGINPTEGKVYAPIDGKISQVMDTLHAVGIEAGDIEILIHVGVDTVDMKGKGFTSEIEVGQKVKKGDLLLTMDLDEIHAAGHADTVILAVVNSDDFSVVDVIAEGEVKPGIGIMQINK